jgi:hypothetical protein
VKICRRLTGGFGVRDLQKAVVETLQEDLRLSFFSMIGLALSGAIVSVCFVPGYWVWPQC